jgi:hypothetical protein
VDALLVMLKIRVEQGVVFGLNMMQLARKYGLVVV